jgi:anti-sigma factor RsiW
VSNPHADTPEESVTVEQLAREMIEASRMIEALASRAAEQMEAQFFAQAKALRKRAEALLPKTPPAWDSDDS